MKNDIVVEQHKISSSRTYASMHRRMVASTIDIMLIFLLFTPAINWLIHALFNAPDLYELGSEYISNQPNNLQISALIAYLEQHNAIVPYVLTQVFSILVISVYCIFFWCTQGSTLGKMLLRIKVIDMKSGNNLTLRQACLRLVGYAFSTLTFCLGFLMIHFQKEHRGLHDITASTAVIVVD